MKKFILALAGVISLAGLMEGISRYRIKKIINRD